MIAETKFPPTAEQQYADVGSFTKLSYPANFQTKTTHYDFKVIVYSSLLKSFNVIMTENNKQYKLILKGGRYLVKKLESSQSQLDYHLISQLNQLFIVSINSLTLLV